MKIFNLKLGMSLLMGLLLISCTQDNLDESKENLNLDFTNVEFNFMDEEFTFEGNKEDLINELLIKLDTYMFSKDLYAKPDEVGNIKWLVSYTGNKLTVKQTLHTLPEDLSKSRSCPDGLTEYASCSGISIKSTTQDSVVELAKKMKSGEQFALTRTGAESTLIFGTPALVDRVRG